MGSRGRIRFIRFIRVAWVCWLTSSLAAPITVTDDLGRKVELREPARRIVTLAPFLTELAFSAGAGERVVGVSASHKKVRKMGLARARFLLVGVSG